MSRIKRVIFLLPMLSLAVFAILWLFFHTASFNYAIWAIDTALFFTVLSWTCSVACGLFVVKQKNDRYPKLAKTILVLFVLSLVSLFSTVIALGGQTDPIPFFAIIAMTGLAWCLSSIVITIIIVIWETIRKVHGLLMWIILFTEILWAVFSIYWFHVAERILYWV